MDRDVFRLIILAIGLLIMAGIYFFDSGRRQQAKGQKPWYKESENNQEDADVMEYVRTVHRDDHEYHIHPVKTNDQEGFNPGYVDQENAPITSEPQGEKPVVDESLQSVEAELISALNDTEDWDEDSQGMEGEDLLPPFSSALDAKVDSELEINAALLEPIADPDKDKESKYQSDPIEAPSIVVLHLIAPNGALYQGKEISEAFAKADLRFGSMEIYHHVDYQLNQELFSIANIREPGTFPEQMTYFETDGMILFMQPMTIDNPLQIFDKMIACADTLFNELGGEMLDDKRQPITQSYIDQQRQWLEG